MRRRAILSTPWNIVNEELPPKIGPRSFSASGIDSSSAEINPTLSSAEPYFVFTGIFGFSFQSNSIFSYFSEIPVSSLYVFVCTCVLFQSALNPTITTSAPLQRFKMRGHVLSGYQLDPTSQWFITMKNPYKIKLCSSVAFLSHHPLDKLLHAIKK